jgi:hypothetical protein
LWFEIPADDPGRAAKFYDDVFGWKVKKWDGPVDYWLVTTGEDEEPGINGAIITIERGEMVRDTISVDSTMNLQRKLKWEAEKC